MSERALIGQKAQQWCDELWQRGDPWSFETSDYEQARCERLLALLSGRRYHRALEIGCGSGYFTQFLAGIVESIVAFDIAPSAIARARALRADLPAAVEFRVANAMDYEWRADGPWDLVVCSDTIHYLGWLYPFFDVAWFTAELFAATRSGGCLLLSNSMVEIETEDKLLRPYFARTYRDLCRNVGYRLESEEVFRGTKNGVDFEILMSRFMKP